jgi:protein-S-isoprenylcysteine O-methyltransferase Ste14
MIYAGCAMLGFLLLFIYDVNSVKWHKRYLNILFGLGCLVIGATTVFIILHNWKPNSVFWGYAFLALFFLGLLIYTLFFALPFFNTYVIKSKEKMPICNTGVYGLCRHPGVLFFVFLYIFLYYAFPSEDLAIFAVAACTMNILYIIFQDLWSFPRLFDHYNQYQQETPFLIPRPSGIRKCLLSQSKTRRESKL